jgi:hypothetical protein
VSVDLRSDVGGEMDFPNAAWRRILVLAEANGWASDGHDGADEEVERFSAGNARGLADALERAMGGGDDNEVARRLSDELTRLLVTPSPSSMFSNEPVRFEPRVVAYWKEFIAFARRGGFSVT